MWMSARLLVFSLVCSPYPQKDLGPPVSKFFWGLSCVLACLLQISLHKPWASLPESFTSLLSNSLGFHMSLAFSKDGAGVSISLCHFGVILEGERRHQTRSPVLHFF